MSYFLSIFFGTFLLEDVALATSLVLVTQAKLSFYSAFAAAFLGISLGDIGVYAIGFFCARFGLESVFGFFRGQIRAARTNSNSNSITLAVIICRAIPGTRLPTYFAAGFLNYSIWRFLLLTVITVAAWVYCALAAGRSLARLFSDHWLVAGIFLLISLRLVQSLIPPLLNYWDRKALWHSWRKWLHFEFWPASLFYLPVVPIYLFHALRFRNIFLPFYANPLILNGGLIGESKWDFLRHLSKEDPATLPAELLSGEASLATWNYPLILKPDIGQRGYGVRIIRSSSEAESYLTQALNERVLAQALSQYSREAGIFYYRHPSMSSGKIFSITDKKFPFVVGDGLTPLGDLILRDGRSRIIAAVYFSRHRPLLGTVIPKGQYFALAECGNHCQGAVFENGWHLVTAALEKRFDEIAKEIPEFHFGRFDIRYLDEPSLKAGHSFEIVEVNGAGSEATHIWDRRTPLMEAYRVLFRQWSILFSIGAAVKASRQEKANVNVWQFFQECFKVSNRKNSLTVSS